MGAENELVVQLGIVEAQLASQVQLIKDAYIALDVLDPKDAHSKRVISRLKDHLDSPPSGFNEFRALKGLEKALKDIREYQWKTYYNSQSLSSVIETLQRMALEALDRLAGARK